MSVRERPNALTHVQYMLGDSSDYIGQTNLLMYLTDRAWTDVLNRVRRNDDYIKALVPVLDEFVGRLSKEKQRLAEHRVMRPWHEGALV